LGEQAGNKFSYQVGKRPLIQVVQLR
jgi:hypothetical protein